MAGTNNGKKFFDLDGKQRKDLLSGVTKVANHFEDILSKVLEENNQLKEALSPSWLFEKVDQVLLFH